MRALLALPLVCLATLACNLILDLPSYKDDCKAVENGKPCCVSGQFEPCPYSGPAGTEDKGICKAGRRECLADGSGFGACTGEVLPAAAEICGNGIDDDCNGKMDEGCICDKGKSVACYSGSNDTRGVGECTDGTHVCTDGHSFGACEGEVVPAAKEDCDKVGDEDCDGHACADTIFAEAFGDQREQHGVGVAVAPDGDIVLVGTFTGDIAIGKFSLIAAANGDEFVARFDKNGKVKWALQIGLGELSAANVAVDSHGDVLVAGLATGTTALALGDASGTGPIFVAKIGANGTPVWSRGCGGTPGSGGNPTAFTAITKNDGVVFGGPMTDTADCGVGSFGIGSTSLFVAQFGSDGTPAWTSAFGDATTPPTASLSGLATDNAGDVWIVGTFSGTIDGKTSQGKDAFVTRLSADGSTSDFETYGDAADQTALALDVDASGHPAVLFHNTGTLHFTGNADTASTSTSELVLAGFDPLGGENWIKQYKTAPVDPSNVFVSLRYDPTGDIVMAGGAVGAIDFGGGSNDAIAFVTKVDKKGQFVWERHYGKPIGAELDGPVPQGLAIAPDRNIVLGGTINGDADFLGGITLKNRQFDALLFEVGY